jgi:formate dehydrogenase subunit gamma
MNGIETRRREPWSPAGVERIVAAHRDDRGPLLPILHDVVAAYGYIDPGAVAVIADGLNLSRAEIHGVITFYRDFRTTPSGAIEVRVCRGEACQAVGAEALMTRAAERLGLAVGATSADGRVTLDEVFCLGNCALGPSALIGGEVHGRLTEERLLALVAEAGA